MVEKLGTHHQDVKNTIIKIFNKLSSIYPIAKAAGYVVSGSINSRSVKTKTEALNLLKELVKAYGADIVTHKDMKFYAA